MGRTDALLDASIANNEKKLNMFNCIFNLTSCAATLTVTVLSDDDDGNRNYIRKNSVPVLLCY